MREVLLELLHSSEPPLRAEHDVDYDYDESYRHFEAYYSLETT